MSAPPTIFDYLDYRQYLADWFDWKKTDNPRFSHRGFARLAGQKSPSLMLNVIRGKRNLTPVTTDAFAKAMKLPAPEREFFSSLVQLDQAANITEKNEAYTKISATKRYREAHQIEGSGFDFLSQWYYPAIHELALCDDFKADAAWIAKTLRPRITVAQAQQALDALKGMGLLVQKGKKWTAADASVVTAQEVEGLAVLNYYLGMLNRAREGITRFPAEQRHYLGVSVAVPERMMPELKEALNEFQRKVLDMCDSVDDDRDRVMQLNLQLFPLSAQTTETT